MLWIESSINTASCGSTSGAFHGQPVNARVGFGHAHFSGNDDLIEGILDLPVFLDCPAQIGKSIAQQSSAIMPAQLADSIHQGGVELVACPERVQKRADFLWRKIECFAHVLPVLAELDLTVLSAIPRSPGINQNLQLIPGQPKPGCQLLPRTEIFGAYQYSAQIPDNRANAVLLTHCCFSHSSRKMPMKIISQRCPSRYRNWRSRPSTLNPTFS